MKLITGTLTACGRAHLTSVELFSYYSSVWTCVAISFDRFMAVLYPFRVRMYPSQRKNMIILILIGFTSFCLCLPLILEMIFTSYFPRTVSLAFFRSKPFTKGFKLYLLVSLAYLVPGVLMFTFSLIMYYRTRVALKERVSLLSNNRRKIEKMSSFETDKRCAYTVVAVIGTFLVLNFFTMLKTVLFYNCADFFVTETLRIVGNILGRFNSATNFIIYCFITRKFRKTFKRIFFRRQ